MKKLLFLSYFILIQYQGFSQLKPIGTWTDHLPFKIGTSIAQIDNVIVCATESGIFNYNTKDFSIEKFSKVNLLNDVVVGQIAYTKEYNTLIIAYENGNIDLLIDNQIVNIPFVKLSNRGGFPKEININGRFAYISYSFGIVVLDIVKREINDSFQFGSGGGAISINSTTIIDNIIYASTNQGYFSANLNANLLDFTSWKKSTLFPNNIILKSFSLQNKLALVVRDGNNDFITVIDNNVATNIQGLTGIKFKAINKTFDNQFNLFTDNAYFLLDSAGNVILTTIHNRQDNRGGIKINSSLFLVGTVIPLTEIDITSGELINSIKPNGPSEKDIFDMDFKNGNLWTVKGGHTFSFGNNFNFPIIQHFSNGKWNTFERFNKPELNNAFDILSVTIDPQNSESVYFSSWGRGIIQFVGENTVRQFLEDNSTLSRRKAWEPDQWVGAGEMAFDDDGNLWVTNTYRRNGLSVKKKNGEWKDFDFSNLILEEETVFLDILISNEGFKWIALPRRNEILVFDDNGTIDNTSDDRAIVLNTNEGQGNVPGNRGIKIEKDQNGLIWIGTSDGIAVHFNPGNVFDQRNRDFGRIVFFDGENNEIVLKGATVLDIAVDGANRKWIATDNSGVLLLSPDGKETIQEFNVVNSPILSNTVNAISIDELNGEVYFATSEGLVSFRSDVISGNERFESIKVAPNPVKSSYRGPILISGLKDNSTVKITDQNGKLVNQFKSQGGAINWDGNNLEGERTATGIYFILVSAPIQNNDVETAIGKIMFLK